MSYLDLAPADALPVRLVIHVIAMLLVVIIVPAAVAVPFIHHLSYLLPPRSSPLSRARAAAPSGRSASAGSCTLQFVLCGLALLHTHTPLNASLLLQHIIFADHKIHPQRFPGRT